MKNNKILIQTAKFAELCNVSKQTLIYYDKIGIFKPDYVDEKGYRYYSPPQHEAFSIISMLREVNTPLEEIKEYLNNKSTQNFLTLLNEKQEEIENKIEHLKKLSKLIEKRKDMTKKAIKLINLKEIQLINLPEEIIVLSKPIKNFEVFEEMNLISELEKYTIENNVGFAYLGAVVSMEKLLEKKVYRPTQFYVAIDGECDKATLKASGLYATIYHVGSYFDTYKSYEKLIDYIEKNNFKIMSDSYEEVLLDSCTQMNEDEYIIQISILVKKS